MKKIAYIELDTHAEIAGNFIELMGNSNEFSVDYYFSEKIIKRLDSEANSSIFSVSADTILEVLSGKEYDLVIIGTVHRYFNVYNEVCERYNTSIIVHNLNFVKISKLKLLQNVFKKDILYRLKLLFKEGLLSAPDGFKKAKNLLVLDPHLSSGKFQYLPVFFTKKYDAVKSANLKIVVPGTVSQKRRDYHHILEKMKTFHTKMEVIFLGKASGEELKWIEETSMPKSVRLIYSKEKIPAKVFDEQMKTCDFLWCPIQRETEFFSQVEIYGKTKVSGNVGDAIKYGKMSVFTNYNESGFPFIVNEKENVEGQFAEILNSHYHFTDDFSKEKVLLAFNQTLRLLI